MSKSANPWYLTQGLEFSRQGKWQEAVKVYQEALRKDPPGNAEIWMNLGFVYYKLELDLYAQEAFKAAESLRCSAEKCDSNGP